MSIVRYSLTNCEKIEENDWTGIFNNNNSAKRLSHWWIDGFFMQEFYENERFKGIMNFCLVKLLGTAAKVIII